MHCKSRSALAISAADPPWSAWESMASMPATIRPGFSSTFLTSLQTTPSSRSALILGVLPAPDALVQHSVAVVVASGRVQLVPVDLAVALGALASVGPAAHRLRPVGPSHHSSSGGSGGLSRLGLAMTLVHQRLSQERTIFKEWRRATLGIIKSAFGDRSMHYREFRDMVDDLHPMRLYGFSGWRIITGSWKGLLAQKLDDVAACHL